MTQENNVQETEVEMEQDVAQTEVKVIHHQTEKGADLAIARKEISQESHKAVLEGRISLVEAKEIGRNAGPDGAVSQQTVKASTPKKDNPVTLCIARGKLTKGGCLHPGADMKMHRIADEYLRGERELTDEQREYLEESGKLEQAKKRAEKKAAKKQKQPRLNRVQHFGGAQ